MNNINIRKARPEDAKDFAKLAVFTAPEYFDLLFGPATSNILENLFRRPGNIYSFEHAYIMEVDGEVAGMTAFYSYKQKNKALAIFVMLLLRYMGLRFFAQIQSLLRFGSIFVTIRKGDLYSTNSAIYPKFRRAGLGKTLFNYSAEKARELYLKRVVVDVKADNVNAIALRETLGFKAERVLPVLRIKGKVFDYIRMVKEV